MGATTHVLAMNMCDSRRIIKEIEMNVMTVLWSLSPLLVFVGACGAAMIIMGEW